LLPYGMLPVALLMAVMMALSLRLHKPMALNQRYPKP
jgi:hypothetical protein